MALFFFRKMKKLLLLCIPFLFIGGCWENSKIKECNDYHNQYYIISYERYPSLDEFDMFYSKVIDKCIAAYHVVEYDYNGEDYTKINKYYIYDALNDSEIKSWEWRVARHWYENDVEYYRTWEWELTWWAFRATVPLEWYWRM